MKRQRILQDMALRHAVSTKQMTLRGRTTALSVLFLSLVACDSQVSNDSVSRAASNVSLTATNANAPLAVTLAESVKPDVSSIVSLPASMGENQIRWPMAKLSTPGRIEHVEQRQGDPVEGRRALLEESYVSCGLPERIYRNLLADDIPVTEVAGRSSDADGLPFSTNLIINDLGVPTVTNNCLTCHGTVLFGELVIGLGNEFMDFTQDSSALVERAGALVANEAESLSWEHYADRIAAIAPYTRMHTIGVNPANNLTFALIAHRDAHSNAWSEEPLLALPPVDPPPVSVPPWWRMNKKTAMFNLGEGRGDHARIMMAASMLCTDDKAALIEIDKYAPDLLAFIKSVEAPVWPFPVNQSLVTPGQLIFESTCSACHGTYGDNPQYPSRLVPLEVVQTDATLVDFAINEGLPYLDWFNRSFFGQIATAAPGPGYVAPPLDGIWATAPFLHNGSVPTLKAVLDRTIRPLVWRHTTPNTNQRDSYDQDDMGWDFEVVESTQIAMPKPSDIYDTRLLGYSNSGHPFGDHLNDSQRTAVLEYLKTL
ncbi:MAG: mono/diheme cytochrome c family protein [Granulosicoccus sp.]|jgi:mono/diheme cytochrome c family protein